MAKKGCKGVRFYLGKCIFVFFAFYIFILKYNAFSTTQTYSIIYYANGGTGAPEKQIKVKNKSIFLSTKIPKRDGHTFLGWATSSSSTKVAYSAGASYSKNASLKLYAVWKANTYKISYNANGGSSAPVAQTKVYGKKLRLSASVPSKTGYTFLGWSKNSNAVTAQYKSGSSFDENRNTVLYAVWKIKTYRISYNANKGQNAPNEQIKKYGSTIILSKQKPVRDGYKFVGWSTEKDGKIVHYKPEGKYSLNKSMVLYAIWIQTEYKINYYANGGSGGVKSQIKKYNEDLILSKNIPNRSGYKFLGWGLSADATTISHYPGGLYKTNVSRNLYAIWGKSKKKVYEGSHTLIAIGSSVGVVKATCTYTEDYVRKNSQISLYNHRTYLSLDLTKLNSKENFVVYPPQVVTHKDKSGKKINSFVVDKKDDVLKIADYMFAYYNTKKVTYNRDKEIVGNCGFFVKFASDTWVPPELKMEICDNIKAKVANSKSEENDTNYYYMLGQIESENMINEGQGESVSKFAFGKNLRGGKFNEAKEIIAKWKGHVVYDTDIEGYIKEIKLSKVPTQEDVINIIEGILLEKELDSEAVNAGYMKSDEEVQQYIGELQEAVKATDNYLEFLSFIKGTGMEENAYWEVKKEKYKILLSRSEYLQKLYQEYNTGGIYSISEDYSGMSSKISERMENCENCEEIFIQKFKEAVMEEMDINIVGDIEKYL